MPRIYTKQGIVFTNTAGGTVIDGAGNLGGSVVLSPSIADNAVTEAKIADLSVTTTKIANAAITNAKIGTAAIGTANIGTLSFNEISGGTATLGGTNNGDGLLSVKNQAGSEVVRLDGSGIRVTDGSISVQNSSGGTIVDSGGLVGTVNFPVSVAYVTNNGTTTANYADGEWGTVPNGTITLTRQRPTPYLIGAVMTYYQSYQPSREGAYFRFSLGGTENEIGPIWGNDNHHHKGMTIDPNGTAVTHDVVTESMSFVYVAPTGTSDLVLLYAVDDRTSGTVIVYGSASAVEAQMYALKLGN